jgi:hypothetical protein
MFVRVLGILQNTVFRAQEIQYIFGFEMDFTFHTSLMFLIQTSDRR